MLNLQDEENFKEITKYAGPSLHNFSDDEELFLIRMTSELVNPSKLINQEITIAKKRQCLDLKEKNIEVHTQNNGLSSYKLLVPYLDSGLLIPANKNISGQISLTSVDLLSGLKEIQEYDLESFKSVQHHPPDLKPRDFYQEERSNFLKSNGFSSPSNHTSKRKKGKSSSKIKNTSLIDAEDATNKTFSESKYKKNKNVGHSSSLNDSDDDEPRVNKKNKSRNENLLMEESGFDSESVSVKRKKRKKNKENDLENNTTESESYFKHSKKQRENEYLNGSVYEESVPVEKSRSKKRKRETAESSLLEDKDFMNSLLFSKNKKRKRNIE